MQLSPWPCLLQQWNYRPSEHKFGRRDWNGTTPCCNCGRSMPIPNGTRVWWMTKTTLLNTITTRTPPHCRKKQEGCQQTQQPILEICYCTTFGRDAMVLQHPEGVISSQGAKPRGMKWLPRDDAKPLHPNQKLCSRIFILFASYTEFKIILNVSSIPSKKGAL